MHFSDTPCDGILSVRPENTSVSEGLECIMRCCSDTNASIAWHYKAVNGTEYKYVFHSNKFVDDFKAIYAINKSNEGCANLVMLSTSPIHAGTYTCQESGTNLKASAELSVLGKNIQFHALI